MQPVKSTTAQQEQQTLPHRSGTIVPLLQTMGTGGLPDSPAAVTDAKAGAQIPATGGKTELAEKDQESSLGSVSGSMLRGQDVARLMDASPEPDTASSLQGQAEGQKKSGGWVHNEGILAVTGTRSILALQCSSTRADGKIFAEIGKRFFAHAWPREAVASFLYPHIY